MAEQLKILLSDYFLKKGIYIDSESSISLTITKIDLSRDLRYAKVFFTAINDSEDKEKIVAFLNKNSNLYKYVIGKKIRTKIIPSINFTYDKMFGMDFETD